MKKVAYALFFLLLILIPLLYFTYNPFTSFLNQYIYFSPCDTPLNYRVGSIDPRFNITQSEFLQDIQNGEAIWEDINAKNMFEYNTQGKLSFNLEYDDRQSLNTQIGDLEGKLNSGKSVLESNIKEYENLVNQFNQRRKNSNDKISYWNSQGGAPPEEFDKLIKEQQEIRLEEQKLNDMARSLNLSTATYNTQVGELNQTIDSFKRELNLRPEEGLYDGKEQKITIYITSSRDELIHTLAHEMGHALGIEHASDAKSIMFPFSTRELVASQEDREALNLVCEKQNKFKVLFQRLYSLLLSKFPGKNNVNEDKIAPKVISAVGESLSVNIIKVVDGDTLKVLVNNKEDTVRLIGIDSPEVLDERKPIQCFGKEASEEARQILSGKKVKLESDPTQGDRDGYGRLLRYIFLENGTNFNRFMIRQGYAREYTFKNNPYRYQSDFVQAEKEARKEKNGLWGSC